MLGAAGVGRRRLRGPDASSRRRRPASACSAGGPRTWTTPTPTSARTTAPGRSTTGAGLAAAPPDLVLLPGPHLQPLHLPGLPGLLPARLDLQAARGRHRARRTRAAAAATGSASRPARTRRSFFNPMTGTSEKCIACYPEDRAGPAAAVLRQLHRQDPAGGLHLAARRRRAPDNPIDYLVHVRKVALPLFPQFGLEPNVYYIPPIHAPAAVPAADVRPRRRPGGRDLPRAPPTTRTWPACSACSAAPSRSCRAGGARATRSSGLDEDRNEIVRVPLREPVHVSPAFDAKYGVARTQLPVRRRPRMRSPTSNRCLLLVLAAAGCSAACEKAPPPPTGRGGRGAARRLPADPGRRRLGRTRRSTSRRSLLQDLVEPRLLTPSTAEVRVRAITDGTAHRLPPGVERLRRGTTCPARPASPTPARSSSRPRSRRRRARAADGRDGQAGRDHLLARLLAGRRRRPRGHDQGPLPQRGRRSLPVRGRLAASQGSPAQREMEARYAPGPRAGQPHGRPARAAGRGPHRRGPRHADAGADRPAPTGAAAGPRTAGRW